MKSFKLGLSFLLPVFLVFFSLTLDASDECPSQTDSATLSSTNLTYNRYENDGTNWNARNGVSRNFYFSIDTPGNVTIELTDIDRNQADFSYSDSSCPVASGGSKSKTVVFNSTGDFNIKVYYLSGTHSSIEYRLKVTLTPHIPPVITQSIFTINEDAAVNALIGTVLTSPAATSFSILSGNTDDLFQIDNSGNITVKNIILDNNSTATYDLNISATNSYGTDTEIITINITDLVESSGGRDFILRTQYNLFGDVQVIGNTVLCQHNSSGQCEESANGVANDDVNLQKAPESYSTLNLPEGATIKYARIYWQGRKENVSSYTAWDAASKTAAGKIQIRKGNSGSFTELTADIQDFNYWNNIRIYSSSADASSIVDNNGTYYIDTASFYTHTGRTASDSPSDGLGASGGWALVVIYEDLNSEEAKNISVFDGYKLVTGGDDVGASVAGFLTPRTGTVDSKIFVYAAEGDKYLSDTSDVIQMAGSTFNTTLQTLGTFNSRVDLPGTRVPELTNNNGVDIHIYDVGTTSGGKGIITTNETGAKFNFTSNQDVYFPSLFVFSTELYLPQLCYDYSLRQDGQYLDIDYNNRPLSHIDSIVSSSDIELTVYLRNQDADFAAEGISISSDVNETLFEQTGKIYTSNVNGSTLIDRGTPTSSNPLCDYDKDGDNSVSNIGCTDGYNIRKGNGTLNNMDYVYTKWMLKPKTSGMTRIDTDLGLSLKYYITAGGNEIEYPEYILGGNNVPLCPPSNTYNPTWGLFNVVRSGQTLTTETNNLYTQISRNPISSSVIFDSTPTTGDNSAPLSDINTTVLVEIADMDAFGDINASCANPDSSLSTPIFVPISFTTANWQTVIPQQTLDYYNFAVKNAAYRVWYFADSNGTLIQNWTATVNSNNTVVTGISGLYNSSIHTECASECSTSTSVSCFNCIRINYAQPICSRDNFSIRPESYDLRIYDINQTNDISDTSNINLSTQYGFNPESPLTAVRIGLAAEYDYRYDLFATGKDGIAPVPGYTRNFSGGSNYSVDMLWDPQSSKTGCNDTNDTSMSFYIANGAMEDEKYNHVQIGEYKINIFDTSWTAVDLSNFPHHTAANGFDIDSPDCIASSTSTATITSGKFGCNINTNHGSDGNGQIYQDHDVTYHPYRFKMDGVIPSHGENNDTVFNSNSFIYMADMSQDPEMSFHLNGTIEAVGFNGTKLSNFVDNCYAKPITLTINKTASSGAIAYQYRFENNDTAPTPQVVDINGTTGAINLGTNDFIKSNKGMANTVLNLNFDRNISTVINPEVVTFNTYDANCTTLSDCNINIDLTTKSTNGNLALDKNITHYYGRTHAPRNRFVGPTGDAFIYYEVYCNGTIGGVTCDKALLQNGLDSNVTDDPRWFRNESHIAARDGNAGTTTTITQKGGANLVTTTALVNNDNGTERTKVSLKYNTSRGYPYKATMEDNASRWLIYNQYNPTATRNEFEVEFVNTSGAWAGKADSATTTREIGSKKTNRRSMW